MLESGVDNEGVLGIGEGREEGGGEEKGGVVGVADRESLMGGECGRG